MFKNVVSGIFWILNCFLLCFILFFTSGCSYKPYTEEDLRWDQRTIMNIPAGNEFITELVVEQLLIDEGVSHVHKIKDNGTMLILEALYISELTGENSTVWLTFMKSTTDNMILMDIQTDAGDQIEISENDVAFLQHIVTEFNHRGKNH